MRKVAVIYPLDSSPTTVTYVFAKKALGLLDKYKNKLIIDEFPVVNANRLSWIFSKAFNSGYDFVIYAGHGLKDKIIGQAYIFGLPIGLIWPMSDTSLAPKVKIFFAVACLTGRVLARDYVRKRTLAYVGNVDYTFIAYPKPEHNYMLDFIDTWITFVDYILKGYTVSRALMRFRERMLYYINLYDEYSERWDYAKFYMELMKRNLNGFRLFGRGDVKLW